MNDNSSLSPTTKPAKKKGALYLLALLCASLFINNYLFLSHTNDDSDANSLKTNVVMPPSLTLITVALGPIRGLIVDALWWKVADLQEASNYFEILPITEWITAMEPRNPYVWTYHAWNLSYNIASAFPTADTRWKWIYNGIKLLRDDARKFNPDNKFIQSELSLLIFDKFSTLSDPQRDYMIEQWIKTKAPYFTTGLRGNLRHLASPTTPEDQLQATALEKNMGMIPKKMLNIDMEYGPFQWELPQAAAVYWGARQNPKDYSQGDKNYNSVITVAMTQAFLFGSYVRNPKEQIYVTTNDLDITSNILKVLNKQVTEGGLYGRQAQAQIDEFIKYAAPIAYALDRPDIAAMLYREQKKNHPNATPPYDHFIAGNLILLTKSAMPRLHQSLIEISLYNAYKAVAKRESGSAVKFAEAAKKRFDDHMRDFGGAASRFTIPPFENIKTAAYARVLRSIASKTNKEKFVKRVSGIKCGPLKLANNDAIIDFSVHLH